MQVSHFLLLASAALFAALNPSVVAALPADRVPAAVLSLGSMPFEAGTVFIAEKRSRSLGVWKYQEQGLAKLAEYPIDFGRGGGNKKRTGDMNTPEGIYFLLEELHKQHLDFEDFGVHPVSAFTTNYPNFFDRRAGKTGYGIWLHTLPDSVPLTRGSKGCVVVRNDVLKQLSGHIVSQRTPLLIFDEIPWTTDSARRLAAEPLKSRVQKWREAWSQKDLTTYMDHYSEEFRSAGMNKRRWERFKAGLNRAYETIDVKISDPSIFVHGDHMVVRFLQSYQSDKKADYGEKVLYWEKESDGQWRIVGESWDAVESPVAFAVLSPAPGPMRLPSSGPVTMDSEMDFNSRVPKPEGLRTSAQ